MSDHKDGAKPAQAVRPGHDGLSSPSDRDNQLSDDASSIEGHTYAYSEDRKIGITGAVFLILNKMIGTGSESRQPLAKPMPRV